jgi:hypothetical protein
MKYLTLPYRLLFKTNRKTMHFKTLGHQLVIALSVCMLAVTSCGKVDTTEAKYNAATAL